MTNDPLPVLKLHVEQVCKPGQGAATCAFLGLHKGWCCAKGSWVEGMVRDRLAKGTMNAKGDNCQGPPTFEPHAPVDAGRN